MLVSTSSILALFRTLLNNLSETINKCIKIKIFPPKTAILLGVMPYCNILKLIADSAILLIMMVNMDNPNRMYKVNNPLLFLPASATENRIKAITPINNTLNTSN